MRLSKKFQISKEFILISIIVCCWISIVYFSGYLRNRIVIDDQSKADVQERNFVEKRKCQRFHGFSKPVDIVFTWVNGSDQTLIDTMLQYLPKGTEITAKRFRDWGNLKYALRSVENYADWIRHVYIVTNGQVPNWLDTGYHKVSIVKHSEIFRNLSHLPTFNAQAIACHIHRIHGLSKSFLYMNDDFFFGQKIKLEDFYTEETGIKIRCSGQVRQFSDNCNRINKDRADAEKLCSVYRECRWNGKDCIDDEDKESKTFTKFGPFVGSLVYTSKAFNREFGELPRDVPSHAPYITDIDTMNAVQERFPKEWERTSSNRFRDAHSFQHGFAYYHFLMRSQENRCDDQENHPVATLYRHYGDGAYYATGDSIQLEKWLFNYLHKKNKKFVCINDHMSNIHSDEEVARNGEVITKFFKEYFPERSKFEKENE